MKKIAKFFLFSGILIMTGLVLSACSWKSDGKMPDDSLKAAATIFPIYDILREVGGDRVQAELVVPPGSSPHTFTPAPGMIKELQQADLFLTVGAGLDDWWSKDFAEAIAAKKSLALADFIDLRPFNSPHSHEHEDEDEAEHEDEVGDTHDSDLDPHYWLDPLNAKIIANQIAVELGALDSDNSEYYLKRAQDFNERLDSKLAVWLEQSSELKNRESVVFHDAWGYFANRFGLEVVASFEPFPGKSPSPKYIENLQAEIKYHQIKALFIEPQLAATAAEALANDLQISIGVLDPIGGVSGRISYLELIDYNLSTIISTLNSD